MKNSKTVGLKSKKKTINIKNKSNKKVVKPKKKIQIKKIKPKKVSKKVVESKKSKKLTETTVSITPVIVSEPKKRKKKSGEKMYFTTDTEKAIIQYNNEQDIEARNEIYVEKIFAVSFFVEK